MTREAFFKEIAKRTEVDLDTVKKIGEEYEQLVFEVIALEDSIDLKWATVSGYFQPPKKVVGGFSKIENIEKRHGWTVGKKGMPKIKWSKEAKFYTPYNSTEYFEEPAHRFTTLAREYRKDWGLPEIPEYQGLSEEEIQEKCLKADEIERGPETEKDRKRREKYETKKKYLRKAYKYLRDEMAKDGVYYAFLSRKELKEMGFNKRSEYIEMMNKKYAEQKREKQEEGEPSS